MKDERCETKRARERRAVRDKDEQYETKTNSMKLSEHVKDEHHEIIEQCVRRAYEVKQRIAQKINVVSLVRAVRKNLVVSIDTRKHRQGN